MDIYDILCGPLSTVDLGIVLLLVFQSIRAGEYLTDYLTHHFLRKQPK